MEKLTRFFTTEAGSGKDTSRLITGRLDCTAPEIASKEINNRERLATLGRTSLPGSGGFVDDETHTKRNGVNEVVRIAIKAKGRILFRPDGCSCGRGAGELCRSCAQIRMLSCAGNDGHR